jgi:plasmid stabilization system protein ParE
VKYRVILYDQLKDDVRRNARWWSANHSHEQAERWFHFVFDSLEKLAEFPESHPLACENELVDFELRELLIGLGARPGYRAIFTIQSNVVHVLTLRAGEEDRLTPQQLPPLQREL